MPSLPVDAPRLTLRDAGARLSPFAPFWMRAFAFALDALFLFAAFAAPFLVAPDVALFLAPAALWWQLALAFAYFAAMNGPLGKGQTFGKLALDIRTVRADGGVLAPAAAARRAALQLAPFVVIFVVVDLLAPWRRGAELAPRLVHMMGTQTGLALLAAHIACLLMSPATRGLHDRWAGSLTAREPIGGLFHDTVAEGPTEEARVLERRAAQTAAFVAFIVIGMGGCEVGRERAQLAHPITQARMKLLEEVREAGSIGGVAPDVRWIASPAALGADGITTTSLALAYRVRGLAGRDLLDGAAGGFDDVLALLASDPARPRDLFFLEPGPDNEPIVRHDAQYRLATLLIEEVFPIFTLEPPLTMRIVLRTGRDIRLPPDAMVAPRAAVAPSAPPAQVAPAAVPAPTVSSPSPPPGGGGG